MLARVVGIGVLVGLLHGAEAQTWCNKNYMASQPIVPPGGQFPVPPPTSAPMLSLRCAPSLRPFLPDDASSSQAILIDTPVRFLQLPGAVPIPLSGHSQDTELQVTVSVDNKVLASDRVPLNATKHALSFSLSSLSPRTEPYNLSCTATLPSSQQTFHTSGALSFLPDPPAGIGSVTKMDLRTGALLARPATGQPGPFQPVFPIGFYTQFDSYLAKNLSVLDDLKSQGFTIVHPVPSFSDPAALDRVLDRMQQVGLYLMYDMRNTYMNTTSVTAQVNAIKARPNLLLWYTADEPDGTSDPLNATANAYDLILSLDGGPSTSTVPSRTGGAGYHPVSLVLNCENYQFSAYTAGADIVLQDTYMIGNNVTFSSQWGTPCTVDYGDCGCDNCRGEFEDISRRMDEFRERLFVEGWDTTKAVWTVPQAFGNETYWKRFPTGNEFVVQSVLGINHGALGVVPWDDPTPPDIKASASALARALPTLTPFILGHAAVARQVTVGRVDVGMWTLASGSGSGSRTAETLVLATNMNYFNVSLDLDSLGLPHGSGVRVKQVFDSGAKVNANTRGFSFEAVGSGAWIVSRR